MIERQREKGKLAPPPRLYARTHAGARRSSPPGTAMIGHDDPPNPATIYSPAGTKNESSRNRSSHSHPYPPPRPRTFATTARYITRTRITRDRRRSVDSRAGGVEKSGASRLPDRVRRRAAEGRRRCRVRPGTSTSTLVADIDRCLVDLELSPRSVSDRSGRVGASRPNPEATGRPRDGVDAE